MELDFAATGYVEKILITEETKLTWKCAHIFQMFCSKIIFLLFHENVLISFTIYTM